MLLVCPSCETAFRVAAEVLAPSGRNVRCTRCSTTWFAAPPSTVEPEEPEHTAEVYVFPTGTAVAADSTQPMAHDVVIWEPEPARAESAAFSDPIEPASEPAAPEPATESAWRQKLSWRGKDTRRGAGPLLATTTVLLGCVVAAALIAPSAFVRMVPDLAGLYAAAGVQVNLRGLEFREIRTTREVHDGVALLVTEGRVANISGRELELPPIRLAALGPNGRELYAWSAAPARATLADGDTVAFKSRLAAPPAEAHQVQVRFMTRNDLAWAYR
jgi:predicted Zn finger-like uncharacterized protein